MVLHYIYLSIYLSTDVMAMEMAERRRTTASTMKKIEMKKYPQSTERMSEKRIFKWKLF